MGAARLGGAETKPLGNGRDQAFRAVRGGRANFGVSVRPLGMLAAASELPWEGCPHSSWGSAARSQPGGNRTQGLSPQATPPSHQRTHAFPPASPRFPAARGGASCPR